MAKHPPAGRCVHCLKYHKQLTWDHIFPESWYSETTPQHIEKWKVPSCAYCNNAHGKNEADLLIRLAMCLDPDSLSSKGIIEKALRAVNPEAGRNDRDSNARKLKLMCLIQQSFSGPNIPYQAIYLGFGPQEQFIESEQVAIKIRANGLKMLTEKIVRGITYLEESQFIENSYKIETPVVDEFGAREFQNLLDRYGKTYERPPGLKIRRAVIPEDKLSGVFEIKIWERLNLYAIVIPKNREKLLAKHNI